MVESVANYRPTIQDLMNSYEKTITRTLFSSFGLDFMIQDQHGGDVDTVHNVNQIGKDSRMTYKSETHKKAYKNRDAYDSKEVHSHADYVAINRAISKAKKQGKCVDGYTGKKIKANDPYDLDHVVAAKAFHDDRGRVLAGVPTTAVNVKENLTPTSPQLNRGKKTDDGEIFIRRRAESGKPLDEKTKYNLRQKEKIAKDQLQTQVNLAYYTSKDFIFSALSASVVTGSLMGVRQGVGLFLAEIWLAVKKECMETWHKTKSVKAFVASIGKGIKKGVKAAKEKLADIWKAMKEGAISGLLTSLFTTFINIFTTTCKKVSRIIRNLGISLVQAFKILFINPDNLSWGEKIDAILKCLVSGAGVFLGIVVEEGLSPYLSAMPFELGPAISGFLGALTTGVFMATGFFLIDRYRVGSLLQHIFESEYIAVENLRVQVLDEIERLKAILNEVLIYDWDAFDAAVVKYRSTDIPLERLQASADMASIVGVAEEDIIHDEDDLDQFMLGRK